MSLEKAKQYLESKGFLDHVIESDVATGTVAEAAAALGVEVWLDESLRKFETVYPAAGNDHSAVRLTLPELEQVCEAKGWVDVCKTPQV
ncbi:hypothetical protein [uncultured Gemmiger sp.]|uniref:hypothetical protein n=1 Tax=uncultured Gemmiger sp. TaxID=1623490 RepID=UPI0025DD17AA|nr:hypothetical protein [uncultured Gemmiger sp.]